MSDIYNISADNGAGSTQPELIEGYTPSRASRNVIHDLLDGSLGVAYVAPRPRSGTLRLLYINEFDALRAYGILSAPTSFTLSAEAFTGMGMKFALDGSLDLDVQAQFGMWWVIVGYQEVT